MAVERTDVTSTLVNIRVELFGLARLLSRRREVEVVVPEHATTYDVAPALADACPELVGSVILEDRSGLQPSYTLNLNAMSFVGDRPLELKPGDTVLLFSSQAGG